MLSEFNLFVVQKFIIASINNRFRKIYSHPFRHK